MTTRVHRFLVLAATTLLLSLPALTAQAQATRTVQRTVDLDRDGTVTVSAFSGRIDVTTWDRASAEIEVRIEGDAQSRVDRTEVRIDSRSRRLEIETDYDALDNSSWNKSNDLPDTFYTLRIPRTASLETNVFSAEVTVENLAGDLQADAFSGNINVRGMEGEVRAEVYSGELVATDVAGSVRFSSFSGSADVTFARVADDSSFETFSGDVTLAVAGPDGFDLDADTGMGGSVRANIDIERLRTDDGYRGAINGGGPRLAFSTFSGDLELEAQ